MKSIDTSKFNELIFGELDMKISTATKKVDKLSGELSSLQARLAAEEKKLAKVKDDIDSYKKQFHVVSELKVDIQAIESLIADTEKDVKDLERTAPEYWKNGIEDYKKIINPYVEQYQKKKAELFEIFIQMIRAQHAIDTIGRNANNKYHLDQQKVSGIKMPYAPVIDPVNPSDTQYFYKNFLEMANGNQSKVLELQQYGELKK